MTYDQCKIPVDKCVIRLCRVCGNSMYNLEYEWDSEYRWYIFYCGICKLKVTLGESISREFLDDDDIEHEPLTFEEQAQMGRINREYEKHQKWDCYRTPNDECDGDLR